MKQIKKNILTTLITTNNKQKKRNNKVPYISQEDRQHIDYQLQMLSEAARGDSTFAVSLVDLSRILQTVPSGKVKGAFNYFTSRLFLQTFLHSGYTETSDSLAVFTDMEAELRRRLMEKIEDGAISKNGDLPELVQHKVDLKPIQVDIKESLADKPPKFFYKICRKKDNKYYSFNFTPLAHHLEVGVCLEYKIGEPTFPVISGSKLMLFDTKENAKKYLDTFHYIYHHEYVIFKVSASRVTQPRRIVSYVNESKVLQFWKEKTIARQAPSVYVAEPPKGTLYADSITLLEEVK